MCMCVHLYALHAGLMGYPLQPVHETKEFHFNVRNINFPLNGKLTITAEKTEKGAFLRHTALLLERQTDRNKSICLDSSDDGC